MTGRQPRDVTRESSTSHRTQSQCWWLDPTRVEGFVHGVFEGGGAKGVLYAGALEGLLRRKLWFKAVAGSSAGAITAAMIAAGMTPAEIRDEKEPGLKAMARPTRWSGYRRMRWGTGFLDHEQQAHDRFIGAAVQRPFQSANSTGDCRMHVAERRGRYASGKGAGVQFVIGVQDQRHVQRAFRRLGWQIAGQHHQEICGVRE